ncbi:unnamed protein product [Ranitomeya imitator]|uniref:Reverse transcriptase domain-containing protein n=1 Tax=Ranitomeya imitator TaxID=111125 RepID=A0ABN9LHG3_9NEOB|nr:unnamed protein product [Ranitomeya imitator]
MEAITTLEKLSNEQDVSTTKSKFIVPTPKKFSPLNIYPNIEIFGKLVQRIPRGFRVPLHPTPFRDSIAFCIRFEQILNKCSFDLITLTIEHLQKAIESSLEGIKTIETQLASTGTPEELSSLKAQIQSRVDQHRKDTENRKHIKLSRNTEDYETNQVYKGQDNFSTRRIPMRMTSIENTTGRHQPYNKTVSRRKGKYKTKDNLMTIQSIKTFTLTLTISIRNKMADIRQKYSLLGFLTPKPANPQKNLEQHPGRPIVAATESILSPIAIYLEKILTTLIRSSKSFLLDTGAFLEFLKGLGNILPNVFLVSLDAKDLYTSIPQSEGTLSVQKLLSSSEMDTDQVNLCIDLLTLDLICNNFMFQDEFFLQTRGTAMGSNMAPPYANCYMADFEENKI